MTEMTGVGRKMYMKYINVHVHVHKCICSKILRLVRIHVLYIGYFSTGENVDKSAL